MNKLRTNKIILTMGKFRWFPNEYKEGSNWRKDNKRKRTQEYKKRSRFKPYNTYGKLLGYKRPRDYYLQGNPTNIIADNEGYNKLKGEDYYWRQVPRYFKQPLQKKNLRKPFFRTGDRFDELRFPSDEEIEEDDLPIEIEEPAPYGEYIKKSRGRYVIPDEIEREIEEDEIGKPAPYGEYIKKSRGRYIDPDEIEGEKIIHPEDNMDYQEHNRNYVYKRDDDVIISDDEYVPIQQRDDYLYDEQGLPRERLKPKRKLIDDDQDIENNMKTQLAEGRKDSYNPFGENEGLLDRFVPDSTDESDREYEDYETDDEYDQLKEEEEDLKNQALKRKMKKNIERLKRKLE